MVHHNDGANVGPSNTFVEGDPLAGTPATQPAGTWLTAVDWELYNAVVGAGLTPNKSDNAQLLAAVKSFMRAGVKNRIHNAGFQINNRTGGAATAMTTPGFLTNRWRYDPGTTGSVTSICQTQPFALFPGQPDGRNYDAGILNIQQTVAASGATTPKLSQREWDSTRYANSTITVSAWLKVASGTLTVSPQFKQHFVTSADVTTIGPNWNLTTTWQLFTWTFVVPSVVGKSLGTGHYHELLLGFPTAATFNVSLYQPQLELGGAVSFFEMVPPAIDEGICARYFESSYEFPSEVNTYRAPAISNEGGSAAQMLARRFRTAKYGIPTMRWFSPQSGAVGNIYWGANDRPVLSTLNTSQLWTGWPTISASLTNPTLCYAHWDADSEP